MLLSQTFKSVGSAASTFRGNRDGFVLGRSRNIKKAMEVRASQKEGGLKTASSKLEAVGGSLEKKLHGSTVHTTAPRGDQVVYEGNATITKKMTFLGVLDRFANLHDDLSEWLGKRVTVQLVSTEIDPSTGKAFVTKESPIEKWDATLDTLAAQDLKYKIEFAVPKNFGVPGAIIVKNQHPNEFLLKEFKLVLPGPSEAHYITNSWVYKTDTEGRIFFLNKAYLPDATPASLKELRAKELANLRGDGTGERKPSDRIYDYDVYNDLGDPDRKPKEGENFHYDRPALGGNAKLPYPRRMRTGRAHTKTLSRYSYTSTESRGNADFYIPRDECFDRSKDSDFKADAVRSFVHGLQSKLCLPFTGEKEFSTEAEIKKLFVESGQDPGGLNNVLPDHPDVQKQDQFPLKFLQELIRPDGKLNTPNMYRVPRNLQQDENAWRNNDEFARQFLAGLNPVAIALVKKLPVFLQELIRPDGKFNTPTKYPLPRVLQHDDNAWRNNDEFARQFLAGLNPVVIKLVKEFPIRSSLKDFGCPVSAITAKHIEDKLDGLSVEEAVENKKLFVADYHDSFLPYVEEINKQDDTKTYATRALLFLTKEQTLKVLALELALPLKTPGGPLNARVFLPPKDTSKIDYLWETAKAHVSNNDIAAHQVFSHFTKCHAVTEAAIITSNRCLSKMHPIMQLMAPHFKSTLEINRQARKLLINAGGQIETHFTPRAYSLEMGAAHYRDAWTFELQALPKDLVARGMAEEDPSSKHGVKLLIEDYPYAADGLELWSAIKGWNKEYVNIIYKDDSVVQNDSELQAWFTELREKAHEDKKDAKGWPVLDSKENLAEILTTMQWIPSCQHAAVNFGQFDYAGYMPHHPTIVRQLIPEEGTPEWNEMIKSPEKAYLLSLASIKSTTTAMSVYEILSAHSPEEEYIGQRSDDWTDNKEAKAAFTRFFTKISKVDELIKNTRNSDKTLKNRYGIVNLPYSLLQPESKESGVTFMGVPNSITI